MHFISLGAGVQSTTMLLMAAHGEIEPKPKYAIFADTGWEPKKVYDHLNWLKDEAKKFDIEVVVTNNGNIRDDIVESTVNRKRFASLPFYTLNPDGKKGMVRRQCTNEYKIVPVRRIIRKLLGYESRQRIKENVFLWMGISTDEIQRVKPSRERWIANRYPLIEKGMNRIDCMNWMERKGYPIPPKSSCIGCPFHNDEIWLDMKKNDPEAWNDAVEIDKEIKKLPRFKGQAFLHPSCRPLDEVNLGEDQGVSWIFSSTNARVCVECKGGEYMQYTKEQQLKRRRRVKKQRQRTRIPPDVAKFIWERDGGRCVRCGKYYTQVWTMEIAHIVPRSQLGEGVPQNLALLCGPSVNTGTCHNYVDYTKEGREWFKKWAKENLNEEGNRRGVD